jgi:glycine cleavage system H protein
MNLKFPGLIPHPIPTLDLVYDLLWQNSIGKKKNLYFWSRIKKSRIMNIPENLKYTKDHEWVKIDGDEALIGVTDYAQQELGDVVFVEIETEGETLEKEEVFGTIEAVKTVSDIFMPVSGEVTEVNPKLEDSPDFVNKDPYGDGWLIKVKISDKSEADDLLDADKYKELIEA